MDNILFSIHITKSNLDAIQYISAFLWVIVAGIFIFISCKSIKDLKKREKELMRYRDSIISIEKEFSSSIGEANKQLEALKVIVASFRRKQ